MLSRTRLPELSYYVTRATIIPKSIYLLISRLYTLIINSNKSSVKITYRLRKSEYRYTCGRLNYSVAYLFAVDLIIALVSYIDFRTLAQDYYNRLV